MAVRFKYMRCLKTSFPWFPASDALRNPSKTSNSSVPSSLTIPSYSGKFSIDSFPTPRSDVEILPSPHVKPFSFNELRNATRNFRPDSLLGEGGFGCVFKGWIDEQNLTATKPGFGLVIAVKKLKPDGFQGHKEWLVCFFLLPFLSLTMLATSSCIAYSVAKKKKKNTFIYRRK